MKPRDLPVIPLTADIVSPATGVRGKAVLLGAEPLGPANGPAIGLVTLGCDKNTVDSEHMIAALVGNGAKVTGDVEEAEVVIVNTCGFIEAAKAESIETILEAIRLKEDGGVKAVVAVGCMVQRYRDELAAEIPEVDLFLRLDDLGKLIPELRSRGILPEEEEEVPEVDPLLRIQTTDTPHTSFLKVSEGCDHSCSFCAIPLIRGPHRSSPMEGLVCEAQALESNGVKELNIVSQDTAWYGMDKKRRTGKADSLLPGLLQSLLAGTSIPWFRLFYMYPSGITRELVELLANSTRILPYLDMPIQHGNDRILELMRRPERQATIRERIRWLREAIPNLTLRTTLVVGFPGETEEDFESLLDFLDEIRFDRVGAFTYSVEEGTLAAKMEGHLPEDEKQDRLEALMDLQREISFESNLAQVGVGTTALVDRVVDGDPEYAFQARTVSQALDVDGVTHLYPAEGVAPGDIVEVEITDALDYDLVASIKDVR